MKQLDNKSLKVTSLSFAEEIETNGGVLPLIIIGAALLLSSCTVCGLADEKKAPNSPPSND